MESALRAAEAEEPEVKRRLREVNDQHVQLSRDIHEAEKTKTDLQPAFEKVLLNVDLRERYETLKKEIAAEEATYGAIQQENERLERRLSELTIQFKKEREAKEAFEGKLAHLVDVLVETLDDKIHLTGAVDDELSGKFASPTVCLEVAAEIARVRENVYTSVVKQIRELEHVIAMKSEQSVQLEAEASVRITEARQTKDEAIRELIFSLQEERNVLHAGLEELLTVNEDQSVNLRRGHVRKARNSAVIQSTPVRAGQSHSRKSSFRREDPETPEVRLLVAKNRELEDEVTKLKDEYTKLQANRSGILQEQKKLEQQMKRDKEYFEGELKRMDATISSEVAASRRIAKENSRTCDAIETLSAALRAGKRHVEHVHSRTVPLPLE
jgi:DNA repair exonuclease SbcCD ATPase subunit